MYHQSQQDKIVAACRQGNRQAQEELYRLYKKAMYNTILRMVPQRVDAEDLLQNAFVEVFMRLDTFRNESTIGAWIKRIVVNKTINFLKSKRISTTELEEQHVLLPDDSGHTSEEESVQKATVEEVLRAVSNLPEGYKIVFNLYAIEGYDHEEIAEILQVSVATSKSQYSRARAKLRTMLGA